MADDPASTPISEAEVQQLTDGLVKRQSSDGLTVYRNAAGVGCPNPSCDRGRFQTLFVSESDWQELGATREGIELCITNTGDRRLVFVHDP